MSNTPHSLTTLRMLRECQSRSAREQQILSGRDWLFVTALVQFLTALYPIYRWATTFFMYSGAEAHPDRYMKISVCMLAITAILFALWGWAKYAPFRAACAGLGFFIALQMYAVAMFPSHGLDNIASRILVLLGLIMAVRTGHRRRHSG